MGYHRAGFEVVGVDIDSQPRYPFEFHRADALEFPLAGFDAIHASPPCQQHTKAQKLQGNAHPDLIVPVRQLLKQAGVPYVIENVPGAPLENPVMLCGTMFGLRLYRHRLFETNFPFTAPLHGQHWLRQVKMGRPPGPQDILQPVGNFSGVQEARYAMEMPWASQAGLREAIPPAYTEYIGGQLMAAIEEARDAA